MTSITVSALTTNIPSWATVVRISRDRFECTASPTRASGKSTRLYTLIVFVAAARSIEQIFVAEVADKRLLPAACPMRHINENGTFCIGLRAGELVRDAVTAVGWWEKLRIFLTCQETAEETKAWPPLLQLSHGDAADIQLRAEALADDLGQRQAYDNAVAYGVGPIAEYARQVSGVTGRLRNGSAECVCRWRNKDGSIKMRRQCAKDNNPCLPVLEARRQKADRAFLKGWHCGCCGTMDDCPLNIDS